MDPTDIRQLLQRAGRALREGRPEMAARGWQSPVRDYRDPARAQRELALMRRWW